MFDNLTPDNVTLYMMKCYDSPNCIWSEYESDVQHIKYIKRLFQKYKTSHDLKERLILNHIICLANVFGVEPCARILFYHIDSKYYSFLKTFLLYLNYLPDIIVGIKGTSIVMNTIHVDPIILSKLESI